MMETYVSRELSSYIWSNAGFYNRIAEEFYSEIAKAKTQEEYLDVFSRVCLKWRRDMSDEEVQRYFLESGEMEAEDVEKIRCFFIQNAQPFQKAVLAANMEAGKKYTLVYLSEHGFPVADKITFCRAVPCQYAQYTDAVKMVFKRARKRSETAKYFCNCSIAIYEGWHERIREDTYIKVKETENTVTSMSKYCCFDARFFTDMVQRLGTPLAEYRNFKVRKSDGKVFA